jgi:hypothetical protein
VADERRVHRLDRRPGGPTGVAIMLDESGEQQAAFMTPGFAASIALAPANEASEAVAFSAAWRRARW